MSRPSIAARLLRIQASAYSNIGQQAGFPDSGFVFFSPSKETAGNTSNWAMFIFQYSITH